MVSDPVSPPVSNSATHATVTRPSHRQFSLRTLFYVISACALLCAMLNWFGPFGLIGLTTLFLSVTPWLMMVLFLLRFARTSWSLIGLTMLLAGIIAVDTSAVWSMSLAFVLVLLWPVGLLAILEWKPPVKRHPAAIQAAVVLTCLVLIGSTLATRWPLRLSFALSRPSLEHLATDVSDGHRITLPQRAGLFRIRKATTTQDGVVCLWTVPDPAGNTGFVHCSLQRAQHFNLWSVMQLSDDWQLISED